jgi:hypothetical protein
LHLLSVDSVISVVRYFLGCGPAALYYFSRTSSLAAKISYHGPEARATIWLRPPGRAVNHWNCVLAGLDSRLRGNDGRFERGRIPNDTTTESPHCVPSSRHFW